MTNFTTFLVIAVAALVVEQCTALQCYQCDTACEVAKAGKRECGKTIGTSQEAVCIREFPKGKDKDSKEVIRKCVLVNKGDKPPCADGMECTTCTSDLCNAAPSLAGNVMMVGVVVAFFVAKLY